MNFLWFFVILFSAVFMIFFSPDNILSTMLVGVDKGINLAISLLPVYVLWSGILALSEKSGLSDKIAKVLSPVTKKLFGGEDEQTRMLIAMNFSANLLGAGGAATPLGIRAVQKMKNHGQTATFSMILFTVINTTSIQLLPSTVITIRAQNGSLTPYDTILPTLIVSIFTTVLGVLTVFALKKRH